MVVYVVLYQSHESKETDVLDVYTNEEKANNRVSYERNLIENNLKDSFNDECWYQEGEVI